MSQIEKIRGLIPDAALRTSFIVGFPGESDSDFLELERFVEDVEFDHLGVFLYSDEEGTGASELDDKVSRETAIDRRNRLMELQRSITSKRLRGRVGQPATVLLEGVSEESDLLLTARTEGQAPEIDGRVLINDSEIENPVAGRFYVVEITDALEYDLLGRILRAAS